MAEKVGRNDPCPCGSGRKYKLCCLAKEGAPRTEAAHSRLADGARLQAAGQLREAVASYRVALAASPDLFEAHVNLGNVLLDLGQARDALACFERAQGLRPQLVGLKLNAARALEALGQYEAAIGCYRAVQAAGDRAAAELPPGYLHRRIAHARFCQGDAPAAEEEFRKAQASDPRDAATASAWLQTLLYSDSGPGESAWQEHVRVASRFAALADGARLRHENAPDPERPLKIGYLSGDFRSHSVAYFVEPVLERHDRARYEAHIYDLYGRGDEVTRRLRSLVARWADCSGLSDEQLAQHIHDDGIDLLVELSGHSEHNRFAALARKPAPVQVSWIGYPMGTGLAQVDWRLSDRLASPDGLAVREPLYRLPRVFCCYRPPAQAPQPCARVADRGGAVVLASFNNLSKATDEVLRLWARILSERPSFHLSLKDNAFADETARERIAARFREHGVGADRISLLTRTPTDAGHLASYGGVDIALDTFPYNGVTTTCEALWMGVPVVSLAGDRFAARMGATLLNAVGYPQWLASDEDGYVRCVLALADDPELRGALRTQLRERMRASPLLDEAGFTRELEAAYREMWRDWCASRRAEPSGAAV